MKRIFIALKIPEEIRKEINEIKNRAYPHTNILRWEPINKLHITLKFIGEVDDNKLSEIIDSLSFISNYKTLNCSLDKFGFFFRDQKPKILWMGIKTSPELLEIVKKINKVLEKLSIKKDIRNFKSHITLLRIKQEIKNNFIDSFKNYNIPEVNFSANEIAIIESQLLPHGSKYKDIKILRLN